jgi:hypothetical protein
VFEGYGVGLTVTPLGGEPVGQARPGAAARPSRLGEVLSVAGRSDAEQALELQRLQPLKAMLAAYEAELVMGWRPTGPTLWIPRPALLARA